MLRALCLLSSGLALAAVGACAGDAPPPIPTAGLAVLLKPAQPTADGTALATQVSLATSRPARYVSASGPEWHLVEVACRNLADCELALQRLRSDKARFAAVERDERKRIVTP